jgi:hypothetical protein
LYTHFSLDRTSKSRNGWAEILNFVQNHGLPLKVDFPQLVYVDSTIGREGHFNPSAGGRRGKPD